MSRCQMIPAQLPHKAASSLAGSPVALPFSECLPPAYDTHSYLLRQACGLQAHHLEGCSYIFVHGSFQLIL